MMGRGVIAGGADINNYGFDRIGNAKYPLNNAEITCEYPYGVSNEATPGKRAKVTVKEGKLLLIKDRV